MYLWGMCTLHTIPSFAYFWFKLCIFWKRSCWLRSVIRAFIFSQAILYIYSSLAKGGGAIFKWDWFYVLLQGGVRLLLMRGWVLYLLFLLSPFMSSDNFCFSCSFSIFMSFRSLLISSFCLSITFLSLSSLSTFWWLLSSCASRLFSVRVCYEYLIARFCQWFFSLKSSFNLFSIYCLLRRYSSLRFFSFIS